MKGSKAEFFKKVFNNTFIAFFFISLLFLGSQTLMWLLGEEGAPDQTQYQAISFISAKLYLCIFPFSLCLGFAARLFETKKPRVFQRTLHFFLCFLAYVIFMDIFFNNTNAFFFDNLADSEKAKTAKYIKDTIPFFVGYPIAAGCSAICRAIFNPKEKKEHKSILD